VRLALVTDAWFPQTNGVVRTLSTVADELGRQGHAVATVTPDRFRSIPCPTYPEIRLVMAPWPRIWDAIDEARPEAVHIATEGPLGVAARRLCLRRGWPFTTSFHTKFPEYVEARFAIPAGLSYRLVRWFHRPATRVMVATPTIARELAARGFTNLAPWTRGVDTRLFRPGPKDFFPWPRPISLYVGRVAVEKNIEAFLRLDLPGTKVVVGDGPQLPELRRRYPTAQFLGAKFGEDLAAHYRAADVFVFPSRTDTFGLVLLEALASGVPAAAFPVPGPLDVVGEAGVLDDDLAAATLAALAIPPAACRAHAETFSWAACARMFLENLAPFGAPTRKAA
jgi:1,2-diacylglycerol 3-alpha-glucosyltransferase/glucuronosyltransferase